MRKVSPIPSPPSDTSLLSQVCTVGRAKPALKDFIPPDSNDETLSHVSDDATAQEGDTETFGGINVGTSEGSSPAAQNTIREANTSDSVSEVRQMSFISIEGTIIVPP